MSGTVAPAAADRDAAGAELRVYERFACDLAAACLPPSDWKRGGTKWTARVRDVSAGGVCLVLGRRFERGAGLAIELPGPDPASPNTLLARVMNVRAENDGTWVLGCALVSPLSDEELAALTRPAPVGGVFLRATLPGGVVVERRIRRLNPAGGWPVPPGQTIGLRLGRDLVRLRVDACRAVGASWILEGTLQPPVPPALLA